MKLHTTILSCSLIVLSASILINAYIGVMFVYVNKERHLFKSDGEIYYIVFIKHHPLVKHDLFEVFTPDEFSKEFDLYYSNNFYKVVDIQSNESFFIKVKLLKFILFVISFLSAITLFIALLYSNGVIVLSLHCLVSLLLYLYVDNVTLRVLHEGISELIVIHNNPLNKFKEYTISVDDAMLNEDKYYQENFFRVLDERDHNGQLIDIEIFSTMSFLIFMGSFIRLNKIFYKRKNNTT